MKYQPVLGIEQWESTLERLVDWAEYLDKYGMVTKREAFERISRILGAEHFGIEHCSIDNFGDINESIEPPSMMYLNMGDTYDTTLVLTDDYVDGVKLLITSWGDWFESNEKHHCLESGVVRCGYCGRFTPFDYESGDSVHKCKCEHCDNNVMGG